jgi:hypothetical protein
MACRIIAKGDSGDEGCQCPDLKFAVEKQSTGKPLQSGDCMRRFVQVLLIAMLALAAGEPATAQDRTTNCRPLAERGRVWVDCCNQSFARNPTRAISRRARLRGIERCVRTRMRHV